ncbi:MAG TPA: ABC transporter permease [Trueperaceae bacterium]|mgnify:CR=1 FL=1|nr:ABC transporter permease [Trueperaceae bacterium]
MLSEGYHHAFRANLTKAVIELRRYLPNTISMILTFYAIFVFLLLGVRFVGDPATSGDAVRHLLVANGFWFLLMVGVNAMGWELTNEALRGTLEQLYMSTVPAWLILLFRMVATLLVHLVILAVLMALSMLTARTWLTVDVGALATILPPTLLGVMGVSFFVAGMTIVFKQVNAVLQLMQFVLMGIAYVPLATVPLLELAPTAKGIDMVRRVMAEGASLSAFTAADWGSLWLAGAVYFALGLAAFKLFERRAMRLGLLGHY